MTPGVYRISKSMLRSLFEFTYRDAAGEATSYGSLIVHEGDLVTFNLSVIRSSVGFPGLIVAELDMFKSEPPPGSLVTDVAHYIIGRQHTPIASTNALAVMPAVITYEGNMHMGDVTTSNMAYYFFGTTSLVNG